MRYGIKETSKLTQWKEEAITINHHVSIGVAVAVEDGLVVPVLKFTDVSLSQIGGSVRDLAGRAKQKIITKWKEVLLPFLGYVWYSRI
jgi:pyruvate/2-oxoglutarate dehydrogenase complex dihydrolipoamide acyltransferase (E2) component